MSVITLHPSKKRLAYFDYKQQQQLIFYPSGGINKELLKRIYSQLDNMLSYYSKVTVVFLQLHQKRYTESNTLITKFFGLLKKRLSKHYGTRIGHVWVREKHRAEAQHYHIAVMLNGHRCQKCYRVTQYAQQIWERLGEEHFSYRVRNRIYRIERREHNRELQAVRTRLSYLAKNATKDAGNYRQVSNASRIAFNPSKL